MEENKDEVLEEESVNESTDEDQELVVEDKSKDEPEVQTEDEKPQVGFVRFDEEKDREKRGNKKNHMYTEIEPLIMAQAAGHVTRRQIRYRLFRIREGGRIREAYDLGLKGFIETQFTSAMNWENFTYEWDVSPGNPLTVIPKDISNYDWLEMGGKFDGADKKVPPAFTHQK